MSDYQPLGKSLWIQLNRISTVSNPVVPPKVEYALTPLGQTLTKLLGEICQWSQSHWHEIEVARIRYDRELDY